MSRGRAGFWLAVGVVLAATLAPALWFVSVSFQPPREITAIPPRLHLPVTLEAYRFVLVDAHLGRFAANSLAVAGLTTLATVGFAACAAYALVRGRGRHRRWVLMAVLAAAMFPQIAIAGSVWRLLGEMGLLNTRIGLALPHVALTLPLAIWVLASYFLDLPVEIEEAALVDGYGRLGVLGRVVSRLAAPGAFTAAILVFIQSWNEFFFALLVLSDPGKQTLPLAVALFPGRFTVPWAELAAVSLLATLPIVALVLVFQRRIVQGLASGAVKG
jgi:multiple sugar transport system permease protein